MPRRTTSDAFEFGQSIVETQVIHPCALVNLGVSGDVQGWNSNICARLISGDYTATPSPAAPSPVTPNQGTPRPVVAGFKKVVLIPLLICLIAQL